MSPEQEDRILIVKNRTSFAVIISTTIWLCIFFVKFTYLRGQISRNNLKSIIFVAIIYILTICFLGQLLWNLFGSTTFTVLGDRLIIRSGVLFLKIRANYDVNKISDMRIKLKNDGSSYWGFQGVRFYDSQVKVLTFYYNKKEINFTANLSADELDKLRKWIVNS